MYKVCVFAGTTEGRELVEFLTAQGISVTACVATEYGETLLTPAENLTISAKRLTMEEMTFLLKESQFDMAVDATHPYAAVVTENIAESCAASETEYLRLLRGGNAAPADAVFVPDIAGAVDYLNTTEGKVLLTTGSKELEKYRGIMNFSQRVYARVLPMEESLRLCREAGLMPAHILAMQGPFSREMNTAMLKSVDAQFLVTKESGTSGGFEEKIAAAKDAGAKLIIIGRPPQREGLSFSQTVEYLCSRFSLSRKPQVDIVGIGPGSRDVMTRKVLRVMERADCIIGAKRMLEAAAKSGQTIRDAIAPTEISEFIHTHPQYRRFAVAMSGDVGFYSGTKKLLPLLIDCDVTIHPGISSLVYLCAKLGTSYEDVLPVSLHGRDHNILRDIRRNRRVFVLVGGDDGMGKLCQRLTQAGLGGVTVSVGEHLSYPDETITIGTAEEMSYKSFRNLSAALLENNLEPPVVTHGIPDEAFLRSESVPMTKSEVRAVCLSKLRLTEASVCWDIGAGTGSVAIEMALQAGAGQVYAVERREAAVEILRTNLAKFAAENVTVVPGVAPEACERLPAPTHAFIGGSSGNMKEILALLLHKNPDVRIVATAITLESIAELTGCLKDFGDTEVVSMTVARDKKAGPYHLMTGQNPIFIFTMQGGKY